MPTGETEIPLGFLPWHTTGGTAVYDRDGRLMVECATPEQAKLVARMSEWIEDSIDRSRERNLHD